MKEIIKTYKRRWAKLEERYCYLDSILSELDEINEMPEVAEQVNLRNTKAYSLLKLEMDMLAREQSFIEKSGVLSK